MTRSSITANPAITTRRVVYGRDGAGRSVIASDEPNPVNQAIWHQVSVQNEIWRSAALPADNLAAGESGSAPDLEPSAQGNVLRIVHFPPDADRIGKTDIVVISREFRAAMEQGETLFRQSDVLTQRGTNHARSNRSNAPCTIAAILNAAQPIARL